MSLFFMDAIAQHIHYVKWDAMGRNDGTNWADAYTSLQTALDAAADGDQIWVARGTYVPERAPDPASTDIREHTFVMKKGVQIFGGFQGTETPTSGLGERDFVANETILSGALTGTERAFHVVVAAGDLSGAVLDGLSITKGEASGAGHMEVNTLRIDHNAGGGLYIRGNGLRLRYLKVYENTASHGAGIYNDGSDFELYYGNIDANNATGNGGGIFNYNASPKLINCHIAGNMASRQGGGLFTIYTGTPELVNSLLYSNSAEEGGAMAANNSNPALIHVTVANNNTFLSGSEAFHLSGTATLSVTNSIVYSNGAAAGAIVHNGTESEATFGYSLVEGSGGSSSWDNAYGADGGNNIDGNPLFVDLSAGNLQLGTGSPAIDGGNNRSVPAYGYRQLHRHDVPHYETTPALARKSGNHVDMGAYEYHHPFALSPDANGILYVNETPPPTSNLTGDSWENAHPSLGTALHDAPSTTGAIWVAAGTYKPTHRLDGSHPDPEHPATAFLMRPNLHVIGGFNGNEPADYDLSLRDFHANETILSGDRKLPGRSGDDNYHVVVAAGDVGAATWDGFTIAYGDARLDATETVHGAIVPMNKGGAMCIVDSSPTLSRITFRDNSALGGGGALYISNGSPVITDCDFLSNHTGASGGAAALENSSAPLFEGIGFSMNGADANGGAVASANGTPSIRHSRFTDNTAAGTGTDDGYGGGVYISGYTGTNKLLEYNEFYGNEAKTGGAIALANTSMVRAINTKLANNKALKSGGAVAGLNASLLEMANSELSANEAIENGGAIYGDNLSASFFNVTVADNVAGTANALYAANGGVWQILNSIIRDGTDGIHRDGARGTNILFYSSNIEGSGGTESWNDAIGSSEGLNIDADPLFNDRSSGDYTLSAGSPAVNKAYGLYYTDIIAGPDVDLLGNPRFADVYIDMGAYERQRKRQELYLLPHYFIDGTLTLTYGTPPVEPVLSMNTAGEDTGKPIHFELLDGSGLVSQSTDRSLVGSKPGGPATLRIRVAGDPESVTDGYDPAELTLQVSVLKKPITVTPMGQAKTYGDELVFEGTEVLTPGLVEGDVILPLTLQSAGATATAPVAAAPYPITASDAAGPDAGKYVITYSTGELTVNKAPLKATANNVTKTYDGVPYSGGNGVSYTGFVNGEDESTVDESGLVYGGDAQGAVNAGSYAIVPTGLTSENYEILPVSGTLTVEKAPITDIVFEDGTFTYDGTEKSLVVTGTLPPGATVVYSNNKRTAVGSNQVTAHITGAPNYEETYLYAVITVIPDFLEGITFPSRTFTYDGNEKKLEIDGTLPEGVTVRYVNNGRTDAGDQLVTAFFEGHGLGDVRQTATLTVVKAAITGVEFEDATFVYNGRAQTIRINGTLPAGASVTYTANSRTDAGSQTATAEIRGGTNYEDLTLTATLTITQATHTIDLPPLLSIAFGDDPYGLPTATNGGVPIQWVSSDESVAAIDDGKLVIVAAGRSTLTGTVPENPNYSNTLVVSHPLHVAKATQSITFNAPATVARDAGTVALDVSASSGLPVVLDLDDRGVAGLTGTGQLEIFHLGTVRITATQPGDRNHEAAEPVTITIRVIDPDSNLPVRVHPAVSPNGDGINDFLIIEGITDFPDNRMYIVNKNGTEVANLIGYDNVKTVFKGIGPGGNPLPAGTYFYLLEVRDNDKWSYQKGYVVLRY